MTRDSERVERLAQTLKEQRWDALLVTLPIHVLLLSGYWPVLGTAIAVATREGHIAVLAPEDERDLAEQGWADDLRAFEAGSIDHLDRLPAIVHGPLTELARDLGIGRGSRVAYEDRSEVEPFTYVSMNVHGAELPGLLHAAFPRAFLAPAGEVLSRLRAVLTPREVGRVRAACDVAERAYLDGARALRAGLGETEVAEIFRAPLSRLPPGAGDTARAGGFMFCMSGPRSARAGGAYQRSTARPLAPGDLALIHCNSYVDGYWTDITRTFCIGEPDDRQRALYDAVFEARSAALAAVRPGIAAAQVDRAAREVLERRGFGESFKHATGHGVGFSAISHLARPRIHPASEETLETGMTFNIEPGIYIDGYGGLRHCDVVTVTARGVELLTPSRARIEELTVAQGCDVESRQFFPRPMTGIPRRSEATGIGDPREPPH